LSMLIGQTSSNLNIKAKIMQLARGLCCEQLKSSDAKPSKCHLKFSSLMMIFIKLVYLSSVISLTWQW